MSIYWPAVASSIAIAAAIIRHFYIQWKDRKNIYSLFVEECMINYQLVLSSLPKDRDKTPESEKVPSVMAFAGAFQYIDTRFVDNYYNQLHKLSRQQIHRIMSTHAMSSQITTGMKDWEALRKKGDDRTELEKSRTRVLVGILFSDVIGFAQLLEKTLKEDQRGRLAISTYSQQAGVGIAQVRSYRNATNQKKL